MINTAVMPGMSAFWLESRKSGKFQPVSFVAEEVAAAVAMDSSTWSEGALARDYVCGAL